MNEQEFSKRARGCASKLWRVSYAILQNGADCDDAIQETLWRAWRQIHTLREEKYFETWLTRILINECRRLLRKSGDRAQPISESMQKNSASDAARAEDRALHDAIAALQPQLRIPLMLHYMEGYSVREVAKMLKLSESAVKWRLLSARKKLRSELAQEEGRA